MTLPPLTHHDILALVEPYSRRGRHLDLAGSDRAQRRLVFKPVDHAATSGSPAMREILQLDNASSEHYRLTRIVALENGVEARLECEGSEAGELLARIESVPPQRQIEVGAGFVIAQWHRLDPGGGTSAELAAVERLTLLQGIARFDGLQLVMKTSTVRGFPADIELMPVAGEVIDLPEDLLAVLGWDWARLVRKGDGWCSKLRLRGKGFARSRHAESKLLLTARHLAEIFAEAPARFHERRLAARWWVVFRRAIPLLTGIAMIAAALAVPSMGIAQNSLTQMLILNSPTLLIALAFCMQELPRLEVPPLPRRPTAPAWWLASAEAV